MMIIQSAQRLRGTVALPGDKSMSHRYAILAAMAPGESFIKGFSTSQDCQSTLNCLVQLGIQVSRRPEGVQIVSPGWDRLSPPSIPLDAGNSGTTMRLLSGLLAAQPFQTKIHGDESLNQRPMKRITVPLTRMGARIEAIQGEFPPLVIQGTALDGIDYSPPVASAQVKSCVLLAGLTAQGSTRLSESVQTRDHTERALPVFGAPLEKTGLTVSVSGPVQLKPACVTVPRDFSAAAFFILAAILVPGSEVQIPGVGVNPTRTGVLDLLEQSGATVERRNPRVSNGEPICDLVVRSQPEILSTFPSVIGGKWIPNVIDEIPALAVLGTRLKYGLRVKDAAELRKKESDRIRSTVENLRQIGIQVEEQPDGFSIPPGQKIQGGRARTYADHRVAMAFAVAGLVSSNGVELDDPSCVAVSFPKFFEQLQKVRQ